jgi:hypothetical protein
VSALQESKPGRWIGVDFDGTLATYANDQGDECGLPIRPMVDRVKQWRATGLTVKIVTARASTDDVKRHVHLLAAWCLEHLGEVLPVVSGKDYDMIELWDDRAVAVHFNTGKQLSPSKLEF